jgi:hypothetical protein
MDHPEEDGENFIMGILALLVLNILVPERVSMEVKANEASTSLKQPKASVSDERERGRRGKWDRKGMERKYWTGRSVNDIPRPNGQTSPPDEMRRGLRRGVGIITNGGVKARWKYLGEGNSRS